MVTSKQPKLGLTQELFFLLYTCLSENSSEELMSSNSHVNRREIKLLVSLDIVSPLQVTHLPPVWDL